MISILIKDAKKIREYLEELEENKRRIYGCDKCTLDCASTDKLTLERLIANFKKAGI